MDAPRYSLNVVRTTSNALPRIVRTPSPNPSEIVALDQKGVFNVRASIARRSKKQRICIYFTLFVLLVVVIMLALLHDLIIARLLPTTILIHNWKFGWLIPIGILTVMSFPPFFGQELIIIVVGLVWGLWVGFAIAAAGTLVGEIANFFVFSTLCRARCERYERTKIDYGCLARVVRDGGLKIAIITRYSLIPPHFTTVVFATCGMKFWVFLLSAIVSLPRHFITVYIGVTLDDEVKDHDKSLKKEKIITLIVLCVTIGISVGAFRYINRLCDNVKGEVIYRRRKNRQGKGELALGSHSGNASATIVFEESTTVTLAPPQAPDRSYHGHGLGLGDSRQV